MNEEVVAWLKLFCKKNFYQEDKEAPNGVTIMKKHIGRNMIAMIAWDEGSVQCRFLLVVNQQPFKGEEILPWLFIHDVPEMKLHLNTMMAHAYEQVFNKVCGTGIETVEEDMSYASPICYRCKHLREADGIFTCKAKMFKVALRREIELCVYCHKFKEK